MDQFEIELLPLKIELESKRVLKKLVPAHTALAELKGVAQTIPNHNILINTLGLQEAKDSSAIENIITTHDELYRSGLNITTVGDHAAKEVQDYIAALKTGFALVSSQKILTNSTVLQIQKKLEHNDAGFRTVPGTVLKNAQSKIVYTPPQDIETIQMLMANLENFINVSKLTDLDPIVKMAVMHYQFESIHPFYDGNGRTGRIMNLLFLIMEELQDLPILYMSSYIMRHKADYYRLLGEVRADKNWEEWILYMIEAVEATSKDTIKLITEIKALMMEYKQLLRNNYNFYSQDLLNNLFKHPYTRIDFVMSDLDVSRPTAASYLNKLSRDGLLKKERIKNSNFYINTRLFELFK